jgi:hypothetical protein
MNEPLEKTLNERVLGAEEFAKREAWLAKQPKPVWRAPTPVISIILTVIGYIVIAVSILVGVNDLSSTSAGTAQIGTGLSGIVGGLALLGFGKVIKLLASIDSRLGGK